ncbi:MAG: helix-turn-helix domain-containing protein [Bdellovibrionales bacterium]
MGLNRWDESNYYEILEVDPSASSRDIHAAYNRAKETYSPESPALYTMFTTEEARELLKMIDEAFTTLSNQAKRTEYDLKLARNGHPSFIELLKKTPASSYSQGPAPTTNAKPTIVGEEGAALKPARSTNLRDELPEGFARTRFGIYEINKALESEFATVEECDGSFVQKVRQYKKVNFEQLSDATRISKSYLAAIENNAHDALPAPVFVRGFVLQIARTLGVPDRLADAYMKSFRKHVGS